MSTGAASLQGTLAQRRPGALVSVADPTALDTVSQRQDDVLQRYRTRLRVSVSTTFALRVVGGVLAGLSVLAMLAIVGASLTDLSAGTFYRSALLAVHGFFAMTVLSAAVDQEMFDLRSALTLSVLAFAADLFLAIVELLRWAACPGGVSQLDIAICAQAGALHGLLPWLSLALALVSVALFVLLSMWMVRRRRELRHFARLALRNPVRDTMDAQIQQQQHHRRLLGARQRRIARELSTPAGVFRAVVAVFLVAIVATVVVMNIANFRGASFYRGALLIVPAHLAGAMFAFFGSTPGWWRWLTLVLAVLSLASAVTAAIVEWPRYLNPALQIELDIVAQEGFFGIVWPVLSTVAALFSLLAAVSVIMSATLR